MMKKIIIITSGRGKYSGRRKFGKRKSYRRFR